MDYSIELVKITDKLKSYCSCVNFEDEAVIEQYLESFLRVLARLFCWVDGECATILKSERQEVLEVKDYETCGCDAYMEIKPYFFKGFDAGTLTVALQSKNGMNREYIELPSDKWNYSFLDGTIIVDLSDYLKVCCCKSNHCGCETTYKLVLNYEAGYTADTLPVCVYEAMCHFLQIFIAYQNKCGSLDDCANLDKLAVGAVLQQKSVDYIVRRWTIDETSIDRIYVRLINRWALQALSSLSLCSGIKGNPYLEVKRGKIC